MNVSQRILNSIRKEKKVEPVMAYIGVVHSAPSVTGLTVERLEPTYGASGGVHYNDYVTTPKKKTKQTEEELDREYKAKKLAAEYAELVGCECDFPPCCCDCL